MSISDRKEPLQCDRGLRRRVIVQSLLIEVFQGRLQAGQHLVTQELADRFGVSHTPIREALIALEGIGIVDVLPPNRGAVIRRVGVEEVKEVCQVRRVLECEATRGACGWIAPGRPPGSGGRPQGTHGEGDDPFGRLLRGGPRRAVDNRLHDLIAAIVPQQIPGERARPAEGPLSRRFRDVTYYARDETRFISGRFEAEAREHLSIIEALLAEDRKAAVRAMSRHIRMSVENWGGTLPEPARGPRGRAGG